MDYAIGNCFLIGWKNPHGKIEKKRRWWIFESVSTGRKNPFILPIMMYGAIWQPAQANFPVTKIITTNTKNAPETKAYLMKKETIKSPTYESSGTGRKRMPGKACAVLQNPKLIHRKTHAQFLGQRWWIQWRRRRRIGGGNPAAVVWAAAGEKEGWFFEAGSLLIIYRPIFQQSRFVLFC